MLVTDGLSTLFLTGLLGVLSVIRDTSHNPRIVAFGDISLLCLLIGYVGAILLARRGAAVRPYSDRRHDAGVLLLRSFNDDVFLTISQRIGRLVRALRTPTERFAPEQRLASLVQQFGPIQAISAPGEARALDGVGLVATVGNWRDEVGELMRSVRIVVLRYDAKDTPGFWWEVEELIRRGTPPTRILVWFPQEHHLPFDMFTVRFAEIARASFPNPRDGQVHFVYFDEHWKARLVMRAPKLLRRLLSPGIDVEAFYIDSQLSPFFTQNQKPLPRLALRQIFIVVAAIVLSTGLRAFFLSL
jgi:hypothetical protein